MSKDDYSSERQPQSEKTREEKYKEEYAAAKSRGKAFFPFTVFTDAIMALVVFGAIVALAVFVGAETGPIADPTSTTYNPRPEWYFLFLFELLKFFPGSWEPVAITALPLVGVIVLLALPFIDRSERRYPLKRPVGATIGVALVLGIMTLTYLGYSAPLVNPPSTESPEVAMGQRVFRELGCLYCHSIGGEGGAVGPDLTDVASRLDEQAIEAYLANPNAMIPQSLHPKLQFTNEEIQALAAYLSTLGAPVEYSAEAPGLFDKNCATCHTLDGSGGKIGPDLSRVGSFRDVGYLEVFITSPQSVVPGSAMPAFGDKLSEAEIEDLAAYLSSFKGQPATSGTSPSTSLPGSTTSTSEFADAAALFAQNCATCHSTPPGAGLTAAQAASVIRNGRGGMPSFANVLGSEQIEELGEYLTGGSPSASTTTTTAATSASGLFAQNCATCHSTRPGAGLTAAQVVNVIRNGGGGMPGFGGELTDEEIEGLAEYLTTPPASTTTTTTPEPGPAWKPLTSDKFAEDLTALGFTVIGEGPAATRVYMLDGAQIGFADLIDYLPEGLYYKDSQGYHYAQEEGAINPTTGEPAAVTRPPTGTTTTSTTGTATTTTTGTATTTTTGTTTTTTTGTTTTPSGEPVPP